MKQASSVQINRSIEDPIAQPEPERRHYSVTPKERICWLSGTVVCVILIALYSWLAQRDDVARITDINERPISRALARASCAPPDAPLERLIGPTAIQIGNQPPTVECIYVRNELPFVPQVRYTKASMAEASK